MKTITKCVLSAAIAAAVATTTAQAEVMKFTNPLGAPFDMTIDPSLKLTYKNYFYRDEKANSNSIKDESYERDEWAHALIADFDTGYINDVIGAVVTVGVADGIDTNRGTSSTNISGSNGLAGFQQAYLKGQYNFGDLNLNATAGVKKRGSELYSNSGSRVLAASSEGFDLGAEYAGLNVYATQINRASGRAESTISHNLSNGSSILSDNKIDHIRILGATYTLAGVDLTAEVLESKDYLRKSFLKAAYSFDLSEDMSLDLDARFARATDAGDLYGSDQNLIPDADDKVDTFVRNSDYESSYYNLNATLNAGNAYVGFGFNKTQDGDFDINTTKGVNDDKINSSADLWEAYALEDEKAYVLSAGYNFADLGMPGLSTDVWYAKGTGAKDVDNFRRRELGAYVSYAFSGDLDGLSLAWYHATYRSAGTAKKSRGDSTPASIYDENINRVYLKYSVAVF